MTSVIVIGAGIGGITTAAHLAKRGYQVKVYEKNQRPGGRCDHFERAGHRFDTGPTLLIMPLVYEDEFRALGVSFREVLELRRVDPTYHLVFDDGSQLALSSDMNFMTGQLEAIEPGSSDGLARYLKEGERHYHLAMKRLVNRDFRTAGDFFNVQNVPLLFQLQPLAPHYRHMGAYFKSERLKSAFTFQDVYMGLSPFKAPATFSMMPYTEIAHGVWYPVGGMNRIVDVLMDIATAAGVEFEFGVEVEQIEIVGGMARAVILEGGRRIAADAVVANADLPYVYDKLLPDDDLAERLEQKQYSCSTISFFWGVDKAYPALNPHTLFLTDDYAENFERIDHQQPLQDTPSLYIHAPARLDPTAAPPGEDTLIAIVPVGHLNGRGDEDWHSLMADARQAVFKRLELLGITDLAAHIKFEMCFNPQSWHHRYNLAKGATHGLSHTLMQLAYLRPHHQHARYPNMFFVGASTHPGTGVPSALISAHQVADHVVEVMQAVEV